ncbi:MAG: hypothetical protein ACMUIU_13410 [bacterium]
MEEGDGLRILSVLLKITKLVIHDMKYKEGYKWQTVTVKIRFSEFATNTKAITVQIPTISIKNLRIEGVNAYKVIDL